MTDPGRNVRPKSAFPVLAFGFAVFGAGLLAVILPAFVPRQSEDLAQWLGIPLGAFLGVAVAWLFTGLVKPLRGFVDAVTPHEDRADGSESAWPAFATRADGNVRPRAPLSLESLAEHAALWTWVRLPSWWLDALIIGAFGTGLGTALFLAFKDEGPVDAALIIIVWIAFVTAAVLAKAAPPHDRIARAVLKDRDELEQPVIEPASVPRSYGFFVLLAVAFGLWFAYLAVKAVFFAEP